MDVDLQKETNRIADAIVELVERANGPVLLCTLDREVAGFAKVEPPSWDCCRENGGVQAVYWSGMTEAGAQALHDVMFGHRVAVQPVSALRYFLEGRPVKDEDWHPVVLLPARAANLYTPQGLFRVPEGLLTPAEIKPGWRPLAPDAVSVTADWL